ncbi:PH domain-containing protein/RhoGAP domain-containing protein/Lzipper-MIP1 domain-containing protein [Cephalotus follicularis]|uniref:PH domain-containing protein/RhoGAP domain-containing protein/Lzipper-MIP1 domain-containing protein n=1 Tax=Cephalotus follicularis TaxID=3775 RepID=A0A1Q3BFV4_CEPFO|nr:PH domain-containing protein/RhoGAP domain-containing protein/Lzipper-MIP1 domain-containing protein [Cephalotus follicularis]
MATKNNESSLPSVPNKDYCPLPIARKDSYQGDGGAPPPSPGPRSGTAAAAAPAPAPGSKSASAPGPPDHMRSRGNNTVFKSGPLFISSRGIGWTSWKKRWFILTRTSLVFFRSDPSAIPQKGSEVNLTLGGIDLNNSGSVEIKADKKLLTVLFPDGRDGRTFTLKAETTDDLYEWKAALENALAQAPTAALVMGQNGIFRNDKADAVDGSVEQVDNKQHPGKSMVLGRPILLALEEVDGTPSFLEKALKFVEEHGVKVEGILRQAADVDDVERRIREYEQGKTEFSPEEDAHIIADCVKYVIRELPSSPVPASCCNALLETCRADRGGRVNAMRVAICETFPEPNRRLLQRILMMMQSVATHKAENRMSSSAVAACMAPLLLRPLLSGDCEIESDFDVGGDGSIQLLKAAAAANHAQAIVITLLEQYETIFGEGSLSPDLYSDSEESGSESEEGTDDDESYEDGEHDESDGYTDADLENGSSGTCGHSSSSTDNELDNDKGSGSDEFIGTNFPNVVDGCEVDQKSISSHQISPPQQIRENLANQSDNNSGSLANNPSELLGDAFTEISSEHKLTGNIPSSIQKSTSLSNGPPEKRPTVWKRTSGKKNLSMESIDFPVDDEVDIQMLETAKSDLKSRIAEEVKYNEGLQASLEQRKNHLHGRRQALLNDVARLQEQLQKERDKRKALLAGLDTSRGPLPVPAVIDEQLKEKLEEIGQAQEDVINLERRVDDLGAQLIQQCEENYGCTHNSCNQPKRTSNYPAKLNVKLDTEANATSHFAMSTIKDSYLDGTETENCKKQQSTSLLNKHPPPKKQPDPVCSSKSRSVSSSATEPMPPRTTASTGSKRTRKGEGTNSTTSALTKLTTRLNFLKERRSQITNELQNMDKGRGSGQAGPIPDKGRGSEPGQLQKPDKSQALDGQAGHSLQNSDRGGGIEGQSLPNSERFRKAESHASIQGPDEGSKGQYPHIFDRGRSEGHGSYNADKDGGFGALSIFTPRTNYR